ncbi:Arc family DNA-binding protein [Sphingobacterium suaedae]|uniref:Arc family DNA-binding protein n=1 Tax=Sphingobacterium suaedae TaxID=1686402 RepID=A0ABW5KGG4_9SPHI
MKKSFVIRIDEDMYKLLEKWAHDEFRSVNGQMEYIISQSLIQAGRKGKKQKFPKPPDDLDS